MWRRGKIGFHCQIGLYERIIYFWPCPVACGILVRKPGMELMPLQWKRGVLTIGPPGSSPERVIWGSEIVRESLQRLKCYHSLLEFVFFPLSPVLIMLAVSFYQGFLFDFCYNACVVTNLLNYEYSFRQNLNTVFNFSPKILVRVSLCIFLLYKM